MKVWIGTGTEEEKDISIETHALFYAWEGSGQGQVHLLPSLALGSGHGQVHLLPDLALFIKN